MQTEYKVQRVQIKNFKNIENLELDLQGKSIFLIGDNALGKSSIIQAIWVALSNKNKPKEPIREGADKAEIMVVIGADGKEYQVKKSFTEKTEKLEITSPEGFKTEKLESLAKLVGDINFDILKFVNLVNTADGRREQVKMIRSFLTEETNAKIDAINENIKNIEENRTEINTNIKRLKTAIESQEITTTDRETYKDVVVVEHLIKQQEEAQNIISKIEESEREIIHQQSTIKSLDKQIEEAEKAWKNLVQQQIERQQKVDGLKRELENAVKPEIEPIKQQIINAGNHNEMVKKIKALDEQKNTYVNATEKYRALGEEREAKNAEKAKLISDSKLPVENLTFDENGLYLKGIPLDETQQSTSELMEVGFKLAIAKDPNVRIVQVPRAESLGAKRLKDMMAFAKAHNFQVFYEEVQRGQEELKIEYIEEV